MLPRTPLITTKRLILRPLELADAAEAQPLFAVWDVVRLLNDKVPWPFPEGGVESYYRESALPAMERGEEWHWAICLGPGEADAGRLIGSIGLFAGDGREASNRGFWIGLPYQGRGYASEACWPVTDFWFDALGFATMRVPKAVTNEASRRISVRGGMRVARTEMHGFVSGRLPAEVWETTADEWRSCRTGLGT